MFSDSKRRGFSYLSRALAQEETFSKKEKENRERESEKRERKLADSTKASTSPSLYFSSFFSSSFCLRTLTETAHAEALNEKNARPEIA